MVSPLPSDLSSNRLGSAQQSTLLTFGILAVTVLVAATLSYSSIEPLLRDPVVSQALPSSGLGDDGGRVWLQTVFSTKDDLLLAPHFISHYVGLGIPPSQMLIILHSQTPDSRELVEFRDLINGYASSVSVEEWIGEYSSEVMERRRNKMMKKTHRLREAEHWIVHADSDQLHQIPGGNIQSFLQVVEDEGYNAVYGHYVDRVTQDGGLPSVRTTPSLFDQFPLACDVTKAVVGIDVPQKVLAFRAYLRSNRGGGKVKNESLACVYPVLLKSHHFKWVHQVKEKLHRRVQTYQRKGYGWWQESQNVLDHLEQHSGRLCVECSNLSCITAETTLKRRVPGHVLDICPVGRLV